MLQVRTSCEREMNEKINLKVFFGCVSSLICLSYPPFCLSTEVPSLMSAAALTCFYSWSSTPSPTLPSASLACCHSNSSTRTATTPSSRPARPSTTITIHSSQPGPQLSSLDASRCLLLSTSWSALPQQPNTPPGPRSIFTHLAFNFRLWPSKPPLSPQCP